MICWYLADDLHTVSISSQADRQGCYDHWAASDIPGASVLVVSAEPEDIGPPSPFALSAADGAAVGGAIASLWVLAWAIRAVRRAVD